jgi:uncharacterized RDD family membrane protein YckC
MRKTTAETTHQNIDRVGELLGSARHRRGVIESPEGVVIGIEIANRGERLAAFVLDMIFMTTAIIVLYLLLIPLFFSRANIPVGVTLILFLGFIARNLYFIHFELAWQGRTPGKKICGLRVINRHGGELSPSAIIARNLTREVEFFLPFSLFMSLDAEAGALGNLAALGWALAISALPMFNRDHLRAGDLIGGTVVISMPRRVLLADLSETSRTNGRKADYLFTEEQLSIYGAFELQVLEELLRSPATKESELALAEACRKICRKIGWSEAIFPADVRPFLSAFYASERASLERGQLFGHIRADKTH